MQHMHLKQQALSPKKCGKAHQRETGIVRRIRLFDASRKRGGGRRKSPAKKFEFGFILRGNPFLAQGRSVAAWAKKDRVQSWGTE